MQIPLYELYALNQQETIETTSLEVVDELMSSPCPLK